uniref:Phosphate regulon transcriptional regulatory protein PhoB n=1 Tax=uncultured bacterium F25-01 TaxID=1191433 RepID=I3VIF7_9BACT|nr:phosphate regulon transcriptional regulatory protein PhoB [uncultured bacterium F25-01]
MARILLVEDDATLRSALAYNLRRDGYEVFLAADGEQALEEWARVPADLVLLDVMLPKIDGFEVLRRLRQSSGVPIVMLTARTDEIDRVVGLEIGADDYVTKPFSTRELLARVKANLRRRELLREEFRRDQITDSVENVVTVGPLRIDALRRRVLRDEEEILLKPKEFELLLHLARHPGQVFPADQLVETVWGYDALGDTRTVRVHIRSLREKLEADASNPELIETVRGVGYRFAG